MHPLNDPRLPAKTLRGTGLVVTALGLGLAALGRPAYITSGRDVDLGTDRARSTMEQRCHDVLDAAYAAGIRYVDTARSYGRAEEFLSTWLGDRNITPGAISVGSKWGYRYIGAWDIDAAVHETKDHSLAMFRRQLPETTALLGRYLGLYQVHSATLESGVLDDRDVLYALAQLRDSGVAVGLSVSGPRQADIIRRALEVSVEGASPFSTVQATWNLLEPAAGPALADAHAAGWGVLVKEAVANGRLTGRGEGPRPRVFDQVAGGRGASLDQLSIAAALSQPWADVVLSGAVTVTQLESNLGALDVVLTDDDRDALGSGAEESVTYWERRASLPWR